MNVFQWQDNYTSSNFATVMECPALLQQIELIFCPDPVLVKGPGLEVSGHRS